LLVTTLIELKDNHDLAVEQHQKEMRFWRENLKACDGTQEYLESVVQKNGLENVTR